MDVFSVATDIIRRIWDDITGRAVIGHDLEDLNEETEFDIKNKWFDLITDALIING